MNKSITCLLTYCFNSLKNRDRVQTVLEEDIMMDITVSACVLHWPALLDVYSDTKRFLESHVNITCHCIILKNIKPYDGTGTFFFKQNISQNVAC